MDTWNHNHHVLEYTPQSLKTSFFQKETAWGDKTSEPRLTAVILHHRFAVRNAGSSEQAKEKMGP